MITITFALPAESSDLVRRLTDKAAVEGAKYGVSGNLAGQKVHIVHTGVGETVAHARLSDYLQNHSPSFLISSGFAGATREDYGLGDLILARNFSDATLLQRAETILRGRNVRSVVGWTVAKILNSAAEREQIWNEHNAATVDMESRAIAQVCAGRSLPMLSLRVTERHSTRSFAHSGRYPFRCATAAHADVTALRLSRAASRFHPGADRLQSSDRPGSSRPNERDHQNHRKRFNGLTYSSTARCGRGHPRCDGRSPEWHA